MRMARNRPGACGTSLWIRACRKLVSNQASLIPCLYYRGPVRFLVYIDDCIVFGPTNNSIDQVVADLCASSRNFTVDDQGDVGDFLGIQVQKQEDGSILLTQPQLIDSIIKDLHLHIQFQWQENTFHDDEPTPQGHRRSRNDDRLSLSQCHR